MNTHNKRKLIGLLFTLTFTLLSIGCYSKNLTLTTYHGAWFDISYPHQFISKSSILSTSNSKYYDSVFFSSKDGKVEFYVYSPQWGGEPNDIKIDNKNEILASKSISENNKVKIIFLTISDNNGLYKRSYVDHYNKLLNTRLVFGIKYQGKDTYNKYKKQYLAFKASLKQYSD